MALEARASSIRNAGDGLWSLEPIPAGTLLPIADLRADLCADPPTDGYYVLDGFVRATHDMDSPCVCDGAVTTLSRVCVTDAMRRPLYFYASCDELLMKANDFGWAEGVRSEREYDRRASRNQLELVMVIEAGSVRGVCGRVMSAVGKGEEIGITYGYAYWYVRPNS